MTTMTSTLWMKAWTIRHCPPLLVCSPLPFLLWPHWWISARSGMINYGKQHICSLRRHKFYAQHGPRDHPRMAEGVINYEEKVRNSCGYWWGATKDERHTITYAVTIRSTIVHEWKLIPRVNRGPRSHSKHFLRKSYSQNVTLQTY